MKNSKGKGNGWRHKHILSSSSVIMPVVRRKHNNAKNQILVLMSLTDRMGANLPETLGRLCLEEPLL